ncbi:hypothetical protein ADN00_17520 [Ornatilinea apprima]|uniref:Band 7 domain-containing protein n=1 Tax=Ornatilinea apprima TaxID=1134406 RepID=A0A0P6WN72_9CHLR|nr:SPFH domain-containing protein [Ornatilinea apprima]KPL71478.1 hypothetical protein ADN00_17520 [Ornatilinea apprima]
MSDMINPEDLEEPEESESPLQRLERAAEEIESRLPFPPSESDLQELGGLIRLFIIIPAILAAFAFLGDILFEHVDAVALAQHIREINPFARPLPDWMLTVMAFLFNGQNFRYMIAPTTAIILVIFGAANYVRNVYHLPDFKMGLRYVIASIFALRYPRLEIDNGLKKIKDGEVNLLDRIGGPGYALVQPGNAVMFRTLREPSRMRGSGAHFLLPFETIGQIASLDEQHGRLDELQVTTRDGFRVMLREVQFRFRIDAQNWQRTLETPYPYSEESFYNMAYNLSVRDDGPRPWKATVRQMVVGAIMDYINSHDIDFLTAPREKERDPRRELKNELFAQAVSQRMRRAGASLLWIDVGFFDVVEPDVDQKRIDLWKADWVGNAKVSLAYGEAKRMAYLELGRAEAQAELIMSITHALENVDFARGNPQNLRSILLSRTAQILEAISSENKDLPQGPKT